MGSSAWLYNGATTIDIGLTGSEYTSNDGEKDSDIHQLNEAGQVSGFSTRFNGGSTNLGDTAWLYNGMATIAIGLTGSEHTQNGGYKYSYADQLNEAGQVRGTPIASTAAAPIWAGVLGFTTARPRSTSASPVANTPVTTGSNTALANS